MKKSLIALAVLGAMAGSAAAQSSVEVYGRIDLNLTKRTGTSTVMSDGSANGAGSSRIGFRGVEDLGGGLKAGFVIETQVWADATGTPASLGNRNSYIDLMGGFGTVRLGRHLNPALLQTGAFSAFGTDYGLAAGNTILSIEGARYDNAISYISPNFSGLTAMLTLASEEQFATRAPKSFRIAYGAGPINAGLAYTQDGAAGTEELIQLGASYNFGMATVMAAWESDDNQTGGENAYSLGARIPVGAFGIRATYGENENGAAADVKQLGLGFDYALSKRTGVYGVYARTKPDAGASTTQVTLGIGHNF